MPMFNAIALACLLGGLLTFYICVVRPILRSHHFADVVFAREESVWQRLCGFRTRLASWAIMIAAGFLELFDQLAPLAAGIDWTPLTNRVPGWLWPVVLFAIAALFRYLRSITAAPEPV